MLDPEQRHHRQILKQGDRTEIRQIFSGENHSFASTPRASPAGRHWQDL
jgi:hypothetical protein